MTRDFSTVKRPGIGGLRPHAAALLTAAFKELKHNHGKKSFGFAILGDVDALAAPRTSRWSQFTKKITPLPWPVGETRQRLLAARKANRQFKPTERRYLEALRLGRIIDIFEGIRAFWRQTRRVSHPWVVVVGLGGTPNGEKTTVDDFHVPFWVLNVRNTPDADRQGTLGFIDLTAALAKIARTKDADKLSGFAPDLWQPGTWPWPVFAETPDGSYLSRQSNNLLWAPFRGKAQLFQRKIRKPHAPWTASKPGPTTTFHINLLQAMYGTQASAQNRWSRAQFTAALTAKSQPGTHPACGQ